MKKERRSCVISVTTLDTQPRTAKHLLINRILEIEPQYVSYVTTSDIQQSIVEWTEGTMEETSETGGKMNETQKMIEGIMKGTSKLTKTMKIKEMQLVNFEKNLMRHL